MTLSAHFGDRAQITESWGEQTVDVAAADWIELLTFCRDSGYEFFDWLTGVDQPPDGFDIVAHVYNPSTHDRLLLRTRVSHTDPRLPSAVGVYRGANWHERETFEMFGVVFEEHPYLVPLLLPDGFEGHPLRKDFVLAARVAKPWPGAKEPGESGHGAPSRRKTLPPGVPAEWGPPSVEQPPDVPSTPPSSPAQAEPPPSAPSAPSGSQPSPAAPTSPAPTAPPASPSSPAAPSASPSSPAAPSASPSSPSAPTSPPSTAPPASPSSPAPPAPVEEPDG